MIPTLRHCEHVDGADESVVGAEQARHGAAQRVLEDRLARLAVPHRHVPAVPPRDDLPGTWPDGGAVSARRALAGGGADTGRVFKRTRDGCHVR
jgi:hypothetical protein